MSAKERERLKLFERVKHGELQQKQAAEICGHRAWCGFNLIFKDNDERVAI